MAFDLKDNWPIVGAGALALFGIAAMRGGGGSSSAGGYQVVAPDTSGQVATAQATLGAQTAQLGLVGSALDSYLHYVNSNNQIDAQNYAVYENTLNSEFGFIAAENAAQVQSNAQLQAIQASKPSFMDQIFGALDKFLGAGGLSLFGIGAPGGNYQGYGAPVGMGHP